MTIVNKVLDAYSRIADPRNLPPGIKHATIGAYFYLQHVFGEGGSSHTKWQRALASFLGSVGLTGIVEGIWANSTYAQQTSPVVVREVYGNMPAQTNPELTRRFTEGGKIPFAVTELGLKGRDSPYYLVRSVVPDNNGNPTIRTLLYGQDADGIDVGPYIARKIGSEGASVGKLKINLNGTDYYRIFVADRFGRMHMLDGKNHQYIADVTSLAEEVFGFPVARLEGLVDQNGVRILRAEGFHSDIGEIPVYGPGSVERKLLFNEPVVLRTLDLDLSVQFNRGVRIPGMQITSSNQTGQNNPDGLEGLLSLGLADGSFPRASSTTAVCRKYQLCTFSFHNDSPMSTFLLTHGPLDTSLNNGIATFVPTDSKVYPLGAVRLTSGVPEQLYGMIIVPNSAPVCRTVNPTTSSGIYNMGPGTFVPSYSCTDPDGIIDIKDVQVTIRTLLGGPAPSTFSITNSNPGSFEPRIRFLNSGIYEVGAIAVDWSGATSNPATARVNVTVAPDGSGTGTSGDDGGAPPPPPPPPPPGGI
ncbi:hypothetical protein HYY71_00865 [Candidatus Woesearchaeota archaeon]|nr:hypothetical protein [Candidatus Woesearchaeota archaeon]